MLERAKTVRAFDRAGLRKMSDRTLWWGLRRHKRKKGPPSLRAGSVGAPATFERTIPASRKKMAICL
jgi:hypothetical protein